MRRLYELYEWRELHVFALWHRTIFRAMLSANAFEKYTEIADLLPSYVLFSYIHFYTICLC